jgi:hypothetical protein
MSLGKSAITRLRRHGQMGNQTSHANLLYINNLFCVFPYYLYYFSIIYCVMQHFSSRRLFICVFSSILYTHASNLPACRPKIGRVRASSRDFWREEFLRIRKESQLYTALGIRLNSCKALFVYNYVMFNMVYILICT